MTKRHIILLLVVLVFFFAESCKNEKPADDKMSEMNQSQGLTLSNSQMQLANISVDSAKIGPIGNEIIFSGKLVVNENTTQLISSRVSGRIEKLVNKKTGDFVRRGDLLYEIYSEELISIEKEYLLNIEKQKKLGSTQNDYSRFIESAKNKLLLYGLTEAQIERIEKDGIVGNSVLIYSSVSGYIREIIAREGEYLMPGSPVVELSDFSSFWIEAQAYSSEMEAISENAEITYTVSAYPNEEKKGRVSFVNPELEENSMINLIRVEIPNPGNKYKPGMMAEVKLLTDQKTAIVIPASAIIEDSKGSSVWVQNPNGSFSIRMVATGIRNSDVVEIVSGLSENEIVVVSGVYLLNSEYIFKNGSDPMSGMKM